MRIHYCFVGLLSLALVTFNILKSYIPISLDTQHVAYTVIFALMIVEGIIITIKASGK